MFVGIIILQILLFYMNNNNESEFSPFQLKTYQILKQIGKGQFGKVYYGLDKNKFEVAIKQISKADLKLSKKRQQLFQTQRTIMKRVNNQNVVRLYESIQTSQFHYLVMEYCNCGDLHDFIKKVYNGFLPQENAIDFLVQLLNGFKGLHQNLIIHRDIKLRNILIHDNSKVKIADFGLSKISEEGFAKTIVGTPYTKAPEVFKGKYYDNKADIWSLGVIFYQMLYKLSYPYTAKNEKALFESILSGKGVDFNAHGIQISDQTQDLIKRMLTPDPSKRIKWRQISEHKVISKFISKNNNKITNSKIINSLYYEKIEKYMDRYNELNNFININYSTLFELESLIKRHKQFPKINMLYYEYLITKRMKIYFSEIRQVLGRCLEISSIQKPINQEQIKLKEDEIENYYEQCLYKLEIFKLTKTNFDEDIQNEIDNPNKLNFGFFKKTSLRLYQILKEKLNLFSKAPNIQKLILQRMRLILVAILNEDQQCQDVTEAIKLNIQILFQKASKLE